MHRREFRVTQLVLVGIGLTLAGFWLAVGAVSYACAAVAERLVPAQPGELAGEADSQLACPLCGDRGCIQAAA